MISTWSRITLQIPELFSPAEHSSLEFWSRSNLSSWRAQLLTTLFLLLLWQVVLWAVWDLTRFRFWLIRYWIHLLSLICLLRTMLRRVVSSTVWLSLRNHLLSHGTVFWFAHTKHCCDFLPDWVFLEVSGFRHSIYRFPPLHIHTNS